MVKICIEIDDEVWYSFKNYVLSKYGKIKGSLGDEVSRALEWYLDQSSNAHTQILGCKNAKLSKCSKRQINLLKWLVLNFDQIALVDLEHYIMKNCGLDKRTKKKYINDFLVMSGFIKPIKVFKKSRKGRLYIIYKVNKERILNFLRDSLSKDEFKSIQAIHVEQEQEQESTLEAAKAYAVERYEMGDSIDEIREDLADFGFELSKRSARNFVCNALREVRE